ncbi:eukaryotic translation initiation factor 2-alpha kinase 1-like [Rhincodon typus]|uniref:eukaryotic translation initiation factor 2-alpha kinase 1-like n=1 Tax=Rhincodon typus TaxID=259920 RepID=UPI00202E0F02|nr:eukaryotic translation initiation factor 2-alpha kinase 1-like [Rhincodon typus]
MQSGASVTRYTRDMDSGVSTPRDRSGNLRRPRAKLAFSFPPEVPAAFDETDLMQQCSLVDCNQAKTKLMDFTVAIPNQLLLVSLLEHLCFVYEKNPQRSMSLFKCKTQ